MGHVPSRSWFVVLWGHAGDQPNQVRNDACYEPSKLIRSAAKIGKNELTLGYNRRAANAARGSTENDFLGQLLMNPLVSDTSVVPKELGAETRWDYKRDLILALILLVISQLFGLGFERIVRWELAMAHAKPLEPPQLYRCAQGNPGKLNDFCQLDCCWYSSIIRSGYDQRPEFDQSVDRANWSFFPLFPLSAVPFFKLLHMESTLSAVVASNVALYFAILAFLFMIRSKAHSFRDTAIAGALVAFNPAIVYAYGGYAEPLYFALAAAGFALLERRRWVEAGIAGGLLGAARPTGILFVVAYLIAALRSGAVDQLFRQRRLGVLLGALLCPVGVSLWMLFMYHRSGDALAWMHMHAAWGVSRGSITSIMSHSLAAGGWRRFWVLLALAGFGVSAWLVKEREYENAAFLALAILMPATAEVSGMQRFLWWQPPTLLATYVLLKRHPNAQAVYFALAGGLASAMTLFWFLGNRPFA